MTSRGLMHQGISPVGDTVWGGCTRSSPSWLGDAPALSELSSTSSRHRLRANGSAPPLIPAVDVRKTQGILGHSRSVASGGSPGSTDNQQLELGIRRRA